MKSMHIIDYGTYDGSDGYWLEVKTPDGAVKETFHFSEYTKLLQKMLRIKREDAQKLRTLNILRQALSERNEDND